MSTCTDNCDASSDLNSFEWRPCLWISRIRFFTISSSYNAALHKAPSIARFQQHLSHMFVHGSNNSLLPLLIMWSTADTRWTTKLQCFILIVIHFHIFAFPGNICLSSYISYKPRHFYFVIFPPYRLEHQSSSFETLFPKGTIQWNATDNSRFTATFDRSWNCVKSTSRGHDKQGSRS